MQIYYKTGFNLGRNKKNLTISMYILENLKARMYSFIRICPNFSDLSRSWIKLDLNYVLRILLNKFINFEKSYKYYKYYHDQI